MKEFEISNIKIKNQYVQAPLAGYTTYPMRALAFKYGCSLAYTEMVSCNAIAYHNKKTLETMLPHKKENGLVALQLFGSSLEEILYSVKYVEEHAVFDFLDFNLGCPVSKVIKQHAGSYLLDHQDDLYNIFSKVTKLSSHPVLAKIRLGYKTFNHVSIAKTLEEAGVKGLAIHGRLQKEMFAGPVHYDLINEVKRNVNIPIIANGNITVDNIDEVRKITNADAFMFGRDAIGYPKLFEDLINKEEGKPIRPRNLKEQINLLIEHLKMLIEDEGEKNACLMMRSISSFYLKNLDDVKNIRMQLVRANTLQEYLDILNPLIDQ